MKKTLIAAAVLAMLISVFSLGFLFELGREVAEHVYRQRMPDPHEIFSACLRNRLVNGNLHIDEDRRACAVSSADLRAMDEAEIEQVRAGRK